MGLFGYGQKDYAKNAGLFKKELMELAERAAGVAKIGVMLTSIMSELDAKYPHDGTGKEMEAIDKRIEGLIATIRTDIQRKNFAIAIEHAEMLMSAVVDARANGKELYTPKELETAEEKAQVYGEIGQIIAEREEVIKEKEKLRRMSVDLDPGSSKFNQNRLRYNALAEKEKTLNADLMHYESTYNALLTQLEKKKSASRAKKLRNTVNLNPAEFAREMDQRAADYEAVSEDVDATNRIAAESDAADAERVSNYGTDAFTADVNAERNRQIEESISNASASSTQEDDPFMRDLKGHF